MRDALIHLLQLAWFMAPAYCSNMAPPFVRYWPGWNRPIHERWFGAHKTVLGFLLGVLSAVAVKLDFAIGALVLTAWSIDLRLADVLTILAMTVAGDVIINRVAFHTGIKDSPW